MNARVVESCSGLLGNQSRDDIPYICPVGRSRIWKRRTRGKGRKVAVMATLFIIWDPDPGRSRLLHRWGCRGDSNSAAAGLAPRDRDTASTWAAPNLAFLLCFSVRLKLLGHSSFPNSPPHQELLNSSAGTAGDTVHARGARQCRC